MKKLKTLYAITVIAMLSNVGISQNLIPNGDFELGPDSTSGEWLYWVDGNCQYVGSVTGPDDWFVVNPSPDRMIENDILCNFWDNDTAQSGNAYIVLGTSNKESAGTTLISSLLKDSSYHLICYLSLETFGGADNQASRIAIKFNNGDSLVTSLISTPIWTVFDTTFTASENSTEMTIEGIQSSGVFSGLKIDNISLEKTSTNSINSLSFFDNKTTIFPNPTKGLIEIKFPEILDLTILNSTEKILFQYINVQNDLKLDLSHLEQGVYFIELKTKEKSYIKKILLIK